MVKTALAVVALCLIASPARAEAPQEVIVRAQLEIDAADVRLEAHDTGLAVMLPGGVLSGRPGEPALPAVGRSVELPPGMIATAIRVVSLESITLEAPGLVPVGQPAIPGFERAAPAPAAARDERIYAATGPFPKAAAELNGTAWSGGQPVAMLRFFPARYLPRDGRLLVHPRIVVEIICEPEPSARPLAASAPATPAPQALALAAPGLAEAVDPALRQYVIVTTAELAPAFAPLAEWKTRKGVPAQVVTVEEIAATHAGEDLAAQVRDHLRSAFETRGATYALLAGPPEQVGYRFAFAMDCQLGDPIVNAIPADLYFADLDGDWNADQDSLFGETTDGVDLLPEIYVGRVTPGSLAEAEAWVAKVLAYEQDPPVDYQTRVLMLGEISFDEPYTDDGIGLDRLDELYFGPEYDPIVKLYESRGNESLATTVAELNNGPHFVLHCGHAHYTVLSVGSGNFSRSNAAALTNGSRSFFFYSVGCLAAAFDRGPTVLGEVLLHPGGGGFASIGNTRYGWAAPGNPGYGYSETFMQAFFREVLIEGEARLGVALAKAKAGMIPFSGSENVYRWHQYCVNLLGDPELCLYTRVPVPLAISAPESIPSGAGVFEALVTGGSGPLAGARVCLRSEDGGLYQVGSTDGAGRVRFAVPAIAGAICTLTATAPDYVAATTPLIVGAGNDPALAIAQIEIDDDCGGASHGNGDGEINPGERVELWVTLRNLGGAFGEDVALGLSSDHTGITVVQGAAAGAKVIAAGAVARAAEPFVIAVGADVGAGDGTDLALTITAAGGHVWQANAGVTVRQAAPYVAGSRALEIAGDGDGAIEPGESALLELALGNRGNGTLPAAHVILFTRDPYVTVSDRAALLGESVPAAASGRLDEGLLVHVRSDCPVPRYTAALEVMLATADTLYRLPLSLVIGQAGFADDLESGPGAWAAPQMPWHVSTRRAHSGGASWYCGDVLTGQYADELEAVLESPTITCPPDAELRLWRYFGVATYGSDGLYIEARADDGGATDWETLDFLGSGGALGTLAIECDWAEQVYALDFPAGTPIRIRFRFVSDRSDGGEGFYLDDVQVRSRNRVDWPVIATGRIWPSPFDDRTFVQFDLPSPAGARLDVFDVSGRRVRTLFHGRLAAGDYRFLWDGRDGHGERVPAGSYSLRLEAGQDSWTWRVMHVR